MFPKTKKKIMPHQIMSVSNKYTKLCKSALSHIYFQIKIKNLHMKTIFIMCGVALSDDRPVLYKIV